MANINKLRFFISSSMGEQVPMELRTVLKALGDRYELFDFLFIESTATPANLDDQMRRLIDQSDGLIMIFHKLEGAAAKKAKDAADSRGGVSPGRGLVKSGVEFELGYALDRERPIFLFVEHKFMAHGPSKTYLEQVWQRASLNSKEFFTSEDCARAIEQSLFTYIVTATKRQLEEDGQRKLTSAGQAVTSNSPEGPSSD